MEEQKDAKKIASSQLHISNPWCGRYISKLANSFHDFTMTNRRLRAPFKKIEVPSKEHRCYLLPFFYNLYFLKVPVQFMQLLKSTL